MPDVIQVSGSPGDTVAARLKVLAHHVKWTALLECTLFRPIWALRASGDINYPVRAVRRHFMVLFFSTLQNKLPSTSAVEERGHCDTILP